MVAIRFRFRQEFDHLFLRKSDTDFAVTDTDRANLVLLAIERDLVTWRENVELAPIDIKAPNVRHALHPRTSGEWTVFDGRRGDGGRLKHYTDFRHDMAPRS